MGCVSLSQHRTENIILAPEAGEGENATDRQSRDQEGPEGDGHALTQPAHLAHILFAAQRVDHSSSAQKEQGFEVSVRCQMEDATSIVMDALAHKHVAKLADGGIGQDALDIELEESNGGSEKGGGATDASHHMEGNRGEFKERISAGNEGDAKSHHRGGRD